MRSARVRTAMLSAPLRRTARRSGRRGPPGTDGLRPFTAGSSSACEPADLRGSETTCPAGSQVVDPDRPDPHPNEPLDRSADRNEHPAQLTLPTLGEDRPIPDELRGGRVEKRHKSGGLELGRRSKAGQRREALVEGDAAFELADLLRRQGRAK